MADTSSSAGTQISIVGGTPATYDGTGFAALSWKKIGKIKNAGEFGKKFDLITSAYLDQRGKEKRKGTFDAGQLNIDVDIKIADTAGQAECQTALDSDDDYNFKIAFKNGDTHYLRGQVTGFMRKIGGPNDMRSASISIELNPFTSGSTEVAGFFVAAV